MEIEKLNDKNEVFGYLEEYLHKLDISVIDKDFERPWGGFFVIDESQASKFIEIFFDHLQLGDFEDYPKLSPKILVVAPEKRLSWQYHHRRAEIWKLIMGQVEVVTSGDDQERNIIRMQVGQILSLAQGERHRLVGVQGFGVVAEIWQHTDINHPSDESDIVRVQDDFGR